MTKARDLANSADVFDTVTATELGYLDGVSSAIQTQINGKIASTLVDAKGDLISATAADTPARLAVGTNGQYLQADSTTATGLKWVTLPSSSPASASATVATAQSTSSSSYTDLATVGPAVTLTTGTKVLVICNSWTDGGAWVDFAVSGATTRSASDTTAVSMSNVAPVRNGIATFLTVNAGSNTFTMKYRSNSGASTYQNRQITVIDLGS